jgi:hypothetical protein
MSRLLPACLCGGNFRSRRKAETGSGVRLTFANGITAGADIVIGADGIHSVVQREIGLAMHSTSEGNHGLQRFDPVRQAFIGKGSSRIENVDGFRPELPVFSGFTGTGDQHGRLCTKQS